MGLVRGTLWDLCNPRSEHGPHYVPPSLPDRLRLVSEAALGLQFLHAAGIAHRDCHPKNVLVTTPTALASSLIPRQTSWARRCMWTASQEKDRSASCTMP
jgi:serine/threonine protein kinase